MDNTAIRARVIELNTERINIIEQHRAELVATQGRERSVEEEAKLARMEADIQRLTREVNDLVLSETRANEAAELREAQSSVFGREPEPDTSVSDVVRFLRSGGRLGGVIDPETGRRSLEVNVRGAARERELLRQGASADEIRALAWDTGSVASAVPSTLARTLYQYMEMSNGVYRMPTRKVPTSSGETLWFPKLGAHSIATQVSGQGTTLAGTDATFARMTLDAFKYGELVKVANEVLTDSGIDIASFLGEDMGRALGRITATPLAVGSGSGAPNGYMTAHSGSGTIATGGSLITPTVEKLIDLQYSIADAYRSDPSACWLMHDSTAGTLRKLRDGAGGTVGAFLWQPSLTQGVINGQPDTFLGKPVYTDSNVASQASNAKTVAFGMAASYYIRTVGNPVVESASEPGFATDETWFRAKWRIDGDSIDPTTGSTVGAVNVIKQSV